MNLKYFTAILILAGATARADVVTWPAESEWNPLYSNGALYSDIDQDLGNNGHLYLDIVGGDDGSGTPFSAGYLLYRSAVDTPSESENQLLFRIRLNADKKNDTGAYQVFFETDGDDSVEYVLQLTSPRTGNATIDFGTASGTNRNGVTFGSPIWSGTEPEYVNWESTPTADGSQFSGNDDFFLDIAMPWDIFSANTGILSTNDSFRMLITSSQSGGQIADGDVGNSSVSGDINFSDVYSDLPAGAVPEPAVVTLILGFGGALLAGRRIFKK